VTIETTSIFIISLILLWIKPGPGQALKITTTLNSGFIAGLYVALGIITGCSIFFLVAVLGTNFVTAFFNDASFYLKTLGGCYLIYLGMRNLRNITINLPKKDSEKSSSARFIKNYPLGLLATLANPLPIFFFLSIIPTLVPVGELNIKEIVIGISIIACVGLIVDGLLIILVHLAKEVFSETKVIKRTNIISNVGFILIGLFLLYAAFFQDNFSFEMI
jgi:threonine/homoserine/homoserine lactone efflux protein